MATEAPTHVTLDARATRARTIAALWREAVAQERPNAAYLVESEGGWRPVSWSDAAARVTDLANGLLALGIRKGDAVAILATNRLEWALADFALASIGAISAAVYANSSAKDAAYVVDNSDSVAVFVEDDEQRAKLDSERAAMPRLRHVLSFAEFQELERRGREYAAANPDALDEAFAAVDEEDVFTYIYTSGTTGPPKGCMIRHRNYYEMARTIDRLPEFVGADDVMLLYLPLAHNFGRLMHLAGPYAGFTIAFLSDPLRVGEVLPQVRPTILPSVPRVFEKVHTAVRSQFDSATGAKRRIVDWALRVGYRSSPYKQRGEALPRGLAAQHRLADRLVYSKIKERLGGRLRFGISGGAPLAQEIAELFHALDILILEGYGLTECTTACTVNRQGRIRFGTVGPALPDFELRIDEDGEILIRSQTVFAGYYKDEAATHEVLGEDGWLRSGDIGELDADGFLRITDRKKDILITAGGKNVAPQNLENALKASPLVSHALVIGDRRPYVAALVTMDSDEAAKWAEARGVDGDPAALAGSEQLHAEIQRIVDEVNRDRSRFEQIKRFVILPRDFSMEEGEVTPTLKLKRRTVQQHFADEIERLYA
jgi:long-chain acyl-CoA synthetase